MSSVEFAKDPYTCLLYFRGDAGEALSSGWSCASDYRLVVASGSIEIHGEDLESPGFEIIAAEESLSLLCIEDDTQIVLLFDTEQFLADVVERLPNSASLRVSQYMGKVRQPLPPSRLGDLTLSPSGLRSLIEGSL